MTDTITRTVQRKGIRINRRYYWTPALERLIGQCLKVDIDKDNTSTIGVQIPSGEYLVVDKVEVAQP